MKYSLDEIQTHICKAAKQLNAEQAWLFGSYARGDAHKDSDVDILFVANMDLPRPKRSAMAYRLLKDLELPKDVLVYTSDEFDDWKDVPGSLSYNVIHEGKRYV